MADPLLHEVAILYAYHDSGRNRATVENFYGRIVRDNPGVPVVPLTCGYPPWLPGTVDVEPLETVWLTQEESGLSKGVWLWSHCDQIYWRYLRSPRRVEAERYVLFDWDTLSNGMSVQEFYGSAWSWDCVGMHLNTKLNCPNWQWWNKEAVAHMGEFEVVGLAPMSGVLLSRKSARCLADDPPPDYLRGVFCELRVPCLLKNQGIRSRELTNRKDWFGVHPRKGPFPKGVFHPIKDLSDLTPETKRILPRPAAAPSNARGCCVVVPVEGPPGPHNITKKLRNP